MSQAFQVAPGSLYRRELPERDPKRRAFIRTFPCVVCGRRRGVEAAHFGPHALGQKASDAQCLPLCFRCHRTARESYHALGPVRFACAHHLNIAGSLEVFKQLWNQRKES